MNNCAFIGRLVATPELRITPSGKNVCNFTLAVERKIKSASGERVSDFINCVAWQHNADFICKWFDKGVRIAVTGELQTRIYEKDGNKNKVAEILVNSVEFADGKRDANANFDNSALDTTDDEFIPVDLDEGLPF